MPFDAPFTLRHTTAKGRALIRAFEGLVPRTYICPAGHPTICIGHVVLSGEVFDEPMSDAACEDLLARDLPRYEMAVCRLIAVPLSDPCFDALVSFTFNLGEGALQASTLRRLANAGRLDECGPQFDRWVFAGAQKLPGLVARRAAERVMWESGVP
jgi:lysozyme